ncbi:MAG: hypothetical protein MJB12_18825 [Firmicutes bacterium]|nr:hypothetical protein [Bacillota bacterium]
MDEKNGDQVSAVEKAKDIYMQADMIDQVNKNQQSNMTLSAYSVITQSDSAVKINGGSQMEVEQDE